MPSPHGVGAFAFVDDMGAMASKFIDGAREQWNGIMIFLGAIRKQVSHTKTTITTVNCEHLDLPPAFEFDMYDVYEHNVKRVQIPIRPATTTFKILGTYTSLTLDTQVGRKKLMGSLKALLAHARRRARSPDI